MDDQHHPNKEIGVASFLNTAVRKVEIGKWDQMIGGDRNGSGIKKWEQKNIKIDMGKHWDQKRAEMGQWETVAFRQKKEIFYNTERNCMKIIDVSIIMELLAQWHQTMHI
jgi:hypothetical protein